MQTWFVLQTKSFLHIYNHKKLFNQNKVKNFELVFFYLPTTLNRRAPLGLADGFFLAAFTAAAKSVST